MKTHYLRALRPLVHACVIAGAFWASYELRQYTDLIPRVQMRIPPFVVSELMMFAAISIGLYILIGRQHKLFQLYGLILGYYHRFIKTIVSRGIVITGIAFFGSGFVFHSGISRFVIVVTLVTSWLAITIIDSIFDTILYRIGRKYQLAVISTSHQTAQETYDLLNTTTNAQVQMIDYDDRSSYDSASFDTIVLVGSLDKQSLQSLADQVTISGQEFFHIQDDNVLQDLIFTPQKLGPLVGLEYKASVIDEWSLVLKRLIDIIGSTIGIIILSPLMAYIAYRIKREDNGPVFFVQRRVGLGGREFNFLKFRSMKFELCTGPGYGGDKADAFFQQLIKTNNNRPGGILPKIKDDPRVTKVGKRIRATSLDELPQLFNVWLGSMSLIGPRPHEPFEVAKYEAWQHRLFSIKPGITGYAQIFGRDTLDFNEEAKLELYYIQNWSIFLDIYVLFATLGVVSKGR